MKSLKKSIFLISLFSTNLFFSCDNNCTQGSGNQVSEDRTISEFSKVEFGGNIKLKIRQDSSSTMRITADDNIQRKIKTRVKGSVLQIEMDGKFCNAGDIIIELSSKQWNGIESSGASQIISENQINTEDFYLDLSGSSKVDLDIIASRFRTESSGSSKIKLKGQAGEHDIDLSGSAEISAFDFVVGDYKIETSGASSCQINALNSIKVNTSGASKILYKGNPKDVSNEKSGASTFKHVD